MVEHDNTRVPIILLLHLVFRVDALPLNLGKDTQQWAGMSFHGGGEAKTFMKRGHVTT